MLRSLPSLELRGLVLLLVEAMEARRFQFVHDFHSGET